MTKEQHAHGQGLEKIFSVKPKTKQQRAWGFTMKSSSSGPWESIDGTSMSAHLPKVLTDFDEPWPGADGHGPLLTCQTNTRAPAGLSLLWSGLRVNRLEGPARLVTTHCRLVSVESSYENPGLPKRLTRAPKREGKVLRVLPSDRMVPRNQG